MGNHEDLWVLTVSTASQPCKAFIINCVQHSFISSFIYIYWRTQINKYLLYNNVSSIKNTTLIMTQFLILKAKSSYCSRQLSKQPTTAWLHNKDLLGDMLGTEIQRLQERISCWLWRGWQHAFQKRCPFSRKVVMHMHRRAFSSRKWVERQGRQKKEQDIQNGRMWEIAWHVHRKESSRAQLRGKA